jgi:imidazolonepropionase-like amidohydrolase
MGRGYLITASRLIDGRGNIQERPVIHVEGSRIAAVSSAEAMNVLPAAELIDASGCTLMPGLIDAHVHLGAFNCTSFASARTARFEVTPQLQSFYALFHAQICFEMGFTTLRDAGRGTPRGDFAEEMCAVRDAINAGIVPGPRILVMAETMITGAHLELLTLPRAMRRPDNFTANGPWELRRKVRELIRSGVDGIKTSVSGGVALGTDPNVRNMTQEELDAIVDEAHAFRKPVAAHCFHAEGLRMCVEAGVDTIEHMVYSDEDSIARVSAAGIWVVPTLLNRSEYVIAKNAELGLPRSLIATQREIQPHCFDTFRRMRQAGVRIAMGTDIHNVPEMGCGARELQLYVDNGMSPLEAISSATRDAATALGLGTDLGTIEARKIADIIAVRGNPADDIGVLQDANAIALVIKEGRLYVDRMAATPRLVRQWKIIDRE